MKPHEIGMDEHPHCIAKPSTEAKVNHALDHMIHSL